MRLVDGEEGEARATVAGVELAQQVQSAFGGEAFRRDVEQLEAARAGSALDLQHLVPVHRRIQVGGLDAVLPQGIHLVLHQRDQRRDDDATAGTQQGGDLVTQRFAAAGGHQHQGIAARDGVLDDLLLRSAEGGVAENIVKQGAGSGRSVGRTAGGRRHGQIISWGSHEAAAGLGKESVRRRDWRARPAAPAAPARQRAGLWCVGPPILPPDLGPGRQSRATMISRLTSPTESGPGR